jgi:hypothetical protein
MGSDAMLYISSFIKIGSGIQKLIFFFFGGGGEFTDAAGHSGRAVWGMNCVARLNTGIVGSNPIQGMDICVHLLCLYCSVCR